MAKVQPECPYEQSWFRNKGNSHGYRVWCYIYDPTFPKKVTKAKSNKIQGSGEPTKSYGAIAKTNHPKPTNTDKPFLFQKPAVRITHPKVKTEVDDDEPFLINIKPSEALEMSNAVIKLGLEATKL